MTCPIATSYLSKVRLEVILDCHILFSVRNPDVFVSPTSCVIFCGKDGDMGPDGRPEKVSFDGAELF